MNIEMSMSKGRNVSNEYWEEVVACDRSPTKSVMHRVPKEAYSGMTCSVSHLIVFGCVAYAHVPKIG